MLLPVPGGPRSQIACPPKAASVSASRASGWPRTSSSRNARPPAGDSSTDGSAAAAGSASAASSAPTWLRSSQPCTSTPGASLASAAASAAVTTRSARPRRAARAAASAASKVPRAGGPSLPCRSSSARQSQDWRGGRHARDASSSAAASARSSGRPLFGNCAGTRLKSTLPFGYANPCAASADGSRSRASRVTTSGMPDSTVRGSPRPVSASTRTSRARPS